MSPQSQTETVALPQEKEEILKHLSNANAKLLAFLTSRANELKTWDSVMVPLDETRFFRLGPDGSTVGFGMTKEELAKVINRLGPDFPRINVEELELVTTTRLL